MSLWDIQGGKGARKDNSKRTVCDTQRSSFIVAYVPKRTSGYLFGQPVDSTRETNAWLGLIAMLQGHNGAKWYGNGARVAYAAG